MDVPREKGRAVVWWQQRGARGTPPPPPPPPGPSEKRNPQRRVRFQLGQEFEGNIQVGQGGNVGFKRDWELQIAERTDVGY